MATMRPELAGPMLCQLTSVESAVSAAAPPPRPPRWASNTEGRSRASAMRRAYTVEPPTGGCPPIYGAGAGDAELPEPLIAHRAAVKRADHGGAVGPPPPAHFNS